ncbi:MAG: hypothetical protein R2747_21655 [Pyrinomonadaceae bacterium]
MTGKICVLLLIVIACAFGAQAQKSFENDKRSVLDYYRLEPDNALDSEAMRAKVAIEDLKNGYLKIEGAFEGYIEVALFRKKDRSPLLVTSINYCGPVCSSDVSVYQYRDGKMVSAPEATLPHPDEKEINRIYRKKKTKQDEEPEQYAVPLVFELPRYGRTIKVKVDSTYAPSDITIYQLDFKNDEFVLIR